MSAPEFSPRKARASSGVHGCPRCSASAPSASSGIGQAEVHADVDDDPHRPQLLGVEEPEPLAGVGEVAQLVHQPLGVQRPALDVRADRAQRGLVGRELRGDVGPLGELQVMARDALVVPDRDQVPQREAGAPEGRQPGAPRAREVLRRARVVRRGGAARGRDHRLDPAHRLREVEVRAVERGDGVVHHRLQPLADRLHALDRRAVRAQPAHGLHRGRPREHLLGLDALLGQDPAVLAPAPRVRVLEALPGAEVRAGPPAHGQGVALAADGVRRPLGVRQRRRRGGSRGSRRPPRRRRGRRP